MTQLLTNQATEAKGFALYVGISESEAQAAGYSLAEIASKLRETIAELLPEKASETYATIEGLVGTQCFVEATPAAGGNTATNPGFQLDGTFLASFDVVNSTVAELSEVQLTFTNGNYTAVTA